MISWFLTLPVILACGAATQLGSENVRDTSCTITKYDVDAIKNAISWCTEITINDIEVPAGETLRLILRRNAKLIFAGYISWGYEEWEGPLMVIGGTNLDVIGAPGSVLDGRGHLWWDGQGPNGGKKKPQFMYVEGFHVHMYNLTIPNSPMDSIIIRNSLDVTIENFLIVHDSGEFIDDYKSSAIDIGDSTGCTFRDNIIINQDCLTVSSGSMYITFNDNYCLSGHGISIGPIGEAEDSDVEFINIYNNELENSVNGIEIKTIYGGTGSISDIKFENITLTNILKYGIVIEGDYENGSPTGIPTGGVPITNLTVKDVHGSVNATGTNVYILVENASNWEFSDIDITGGTNVQECSGIPDNAGISC